MDTTLPFFASQLSKLSLNESLLSRFNKILS